MGIYGENRSKCCQAGRSRLTSQDKKKQKADGEGEEGGRNEGSTHKEEKLFQGLSLPR